MTYIAIYIGLVFLITCAAVLALQQLSENADNIEKYQLLSKIGTSEKMINHAIKAQIILYFCLPLSLAFDSFLCRNQNSKNPDINVRTD